MLKIFNELSPFIEDNYVELGVREYSRIMNVSPPTASTILNNYESIGLLKKRDERKYILFRANRENVILKDLARIYWKIKLSNLIDKLNEELHNPTIILFGSLAKLETKKDSDIDLAIITNLNKKINLEKHENKFKRKIEIFKFPSMKEIPQNLKTSVLNGYILQGEI